MHFEEYLYVAIGKRIRERRNELSMTQDELANADHVDLMRTSITNIEYGQQRIQVHTLYAIADALGLSVYDLMPNIELDKERTVEEIISDRAVVSADEKEGLDATERQLILDLLTEE
jgi:transcriptional regulator with XRE-family HTH domain